MPSIVPRSSTKYSAEVPSGRWSAFGQILIVTVAGACFFVICHTAEHDLVLSLAKCERYLLLQQLRKAPKCLAHAGRRVGACKSPVIACSLAAVINLGSGPTLITSSDKCSIAQVKNPRDCCTLAEEWSDGMACAEFPS